MNARVAFNLMLMIILTFALGAITLGGATMLNKTSSISSSSEAPHLCFEEQEYSHGGWDNNGAYVCTVDEQKVTEAEDYAIFLQNQVAFSAALQKWELVQLLTIIGTMLTLTSAVATVIYWNHNR